MKPIMNCSHCSKADWFEDRSVGIFGYYDCNNQNIPDNYDEELGSDEVDCPFFEPIIIEKCGNCNRPMNVPQWLWKIWYYSWDAIPCCCDECKNELKAKEIKEIEEYKKHMESTI